MSKAKAKTDCPSAVAWLTTIRDRHVGKRPAEAAEKALAALEAGKMDDAVACGMVAAAGDAVMTLAQAYQPAAVAFANQEIKMEMSRQKKSDKASTRHAEIRLAVEERIKKRGRHKDPSDTAIYSDTAMEFGISVPTVRRAIGKK